MVLLRTTRSEEHTSELQSLRQLVCRLLHATQTTQICPLSLHDALPIYAAAGAGGCSAAAARPACPAPGLRRWPLRPRAAPPRRRPGDRRPRRRRAGSSPSARWCCCAPRDRKSTRLNSSHLGNSSAVFSMLHRPPRSALFPYTTLFRSMLQPAQVVVLRLQLDRLALLQGFVDGLFDLAQRLLVAGQVIVDPEDAAQEVLHLHDGVAAHHEIGRAHV